ncbi:MAG: hypothetical protein WCV81_04710 [Microgenomates group bacterium]|jgi:hypothetical protein
MENPVKKHLYEALQSLDPRYSDAGYLSRTIKHMMKIMDEGRKIRHSLLSPVSRELVESAEDVIGEKLNRLVAVPEPPAVAFKVLETAEKLGISDLKLCYLPEINLLDLKKNHPIFQKRPISLGIHDTVFDLMERRKMSSIIRSGWRLFTPTPQYDNPELSDEGISISGSGKGLRPSRIMKYIVPTMNERLGFSKETPFLSLPSIAEIILMDILSPELLEENKKFRHSVYLSEWCLDKAFKGYGYTFVPCKVLNGFHEYFVEFPLTGAYRSGYRLIGNFANLE